MKRFAFFISTLVSLSATAQQDTTELLPVEVRAVRAGATAPFAKTTLSKNDIRKQNLGQDLPFLLNQTPSVIVHSDAGNGVGYTGIRIRGTDATRINVTLNGIPYNDAESQGTFFVDLPDFASSVSSVQVQRGVGTSTNGAGAFGASIHFSTNEVRRQPYAEINNSYGSFNTLKNTVMAGTGLLGDHFIADVRLSRIASDGYIDRATSSLKSLYFSTAYLSAKTDLRLNVFTGKEKTYQAWYGVSEADLPTNRTINYAGMERTGEPYDNETDNYRQDHYQFFFTHRFLPDLVFNTALFLTHGEGYYEQYKAQQRYSKYNLEEPVVGPDTIDRSDMVRQLWLDNNFYGNIFSLQHTRGKTSLIFGGAISRYDGRHFGEIVWAQQGLSGNTRWYDHDASKNDLNTYIKWEQALLPSLNLFADLQYRNVKYSIEGFRDNPTVQVTNRYDFVNPKLGLSWHRKQVTAYASFSMAAKEPNRDDFEAGLSEQPRPEKLRDLELGIEYKAGGNFAGVNLYRMDYKDQLVLTGRINDVGAYTRTNIPESYRMGVELQGAATLTTWLRASANLTLSRNRIKNFTEYIDDYDTFTQVSKQYGETDISFSPSVIAGGTVAFLPVKSLQLDVINKYVGRQFLDNTGNSSRSLDPFYIADVRTVYTFAHKLFKQVQVVFQVNNVLDELYEPNGYTFSYITGAQLVTENYYFPMAGRNFMTGLNIQIGK
ncbi:MAG TPA: TonB-dependent receptor [Flavisolibacter sp.]